MKTLETGSCTILHRETVLELEEAVGRVVEAGLAAAAVVDRSCNIFAVAGPLTEDEVRQIVRTVTHRPTTDRIARRVFSGEMVEVPFDDRTAGVGVAARFVFVVVVFAAVNRRSRMLATALQREVERLLGETKTEVDAPPWTRGGGGSSSGPASLPVIEYGVTVPRRDRAKA